jgi:hypothetical protein
MCWSGLHAHNKSLPIASMCVSNPNRSPAGIDGCNTATTPTGFANIVSNDFLVPPHCAVTLMVVLSSFIVSEKFAVYCPRASIYITFSLPCRKQKRQNPAYHEKPEIIVTVLLADQYKIRSQRSLIK